jgi:ATP-binding cassette subfamily B protein
MTSLKLQFRVLQALGKDAGLARWIAIVNVVLVVSSLAEPLIFGHIIDLLSKSSPSTIWSVVWLYVLAWIGFGLLSISTGAWISLQADRLAHRRRHVVLRNYFEHVLQLPLSQYAKSHSGRLMKIMLQGVDALWGLWLFFFRDHLANLLAIALLIPVSFVVNWRLALLLLFLCLIFAALTHYILSKTHALQTEVEGYNSALAERAADTLGNVALVQSFASVSQEVRAMSSISQHLLQAQIPVLSWWALINILARTATTLVVLSILVCGVYLYSEDQISVGEIVTFVVFSGLVISRLESLIGFINRMTMDAPRVRDFFSVLDTVSSIKDGPNAVDPGRVKGYVSFEQVGFSYDGKRSILSDISFTAAPGEMIALVGSSGAGKSTALALLYRAMDPSRGTISIDGIDIREMQLTGLRQNIGVVFQEALLFNRSIAENLRIGSPEASDQELMSALERAQAGELLKRNPEGLYAQIGERGRGLSGGERQRLAIARVLLKDPPILILDEATSALDGGTEKKLLVALEQLVQSRCTLVIAHRLNTIRRASKILVFDNGCIVEAGTFDELFAKKGVFFQLANEQFLAHEESES